MGVVSERPVVFIVPGGNVAVSLAYVRFSTVTTGEFVNAGAREFVVIVCVTGKEIVLCVVSTKSNM